MDLPDTRALEIVVEKLAAERRQLVELAGWRLWMSVTTGGAIATLSGLAVYTTLLSIESGCVMALVDLMVMLARRVLLDDVDQQIRRHRDAAEDCCQTAARCMDDW